MLKFAMPLVVAGCVVQLGWMLALAHDIFWEPDKFPFYPVLAAQIVFAFLAGSLMRSQWRATFAGFLIAISATLAFAICSRMTTIEQFMFDERAEWLISSICQALFGIPLMAAIALMGKFINSRAPRVAVRLIPVAVLLAILAGTQLWTGAWVFNRAPYSTLIIRASTDEPARLDGVCYELIEVGAYYDSGWYVGCTGDDGRPGEIAIGRKQRDPIYYRIKVVAKPDWCRALPDSYSSSTRIDRPGEIVETIVFKCSG